MVSQQNYWFDMQHLSYTPLHYLPLKASFSLLLRKILSKISNGYFGLKLFSISNIHDDSWCCNSRITAKNLIIHKSLLRNPIKISV